MVEPIKPKEAQELRLIMVPNQVIEAFNELITENLSGGYASFKTKEVVDRIVAKLGWSNTTATRDEVYEKGWLSDIPRLYRKQGWKVVHDRPGYNESYDAHFDFTEKGNNED